MDFNFCSKYSGLDFHWWHKLLRFVLVLFFLGGIFGFVFNSEVYWIQSVSADTIMEELDSYRPENLPWDWLFDQAEKKETGTGSNLGNVKEGIVTLVGKVIEILLYLAGTIAVIAVIYGGTLYVFSFGSENTENAKKMIIWALIGLVIVLLSYAIVYNIVDILLTKSK